jgi:hypothetical protein
LGWYSYHSFACEYTFQTRGIAPAVGIVGWSRRSRESLLEWCQQCFGALPTALPDDGEIGGGANRSDRRLGASPKLLPAVSS